MKTLKKHEEFRFLHLLDVEQITYKAQVQESELKNRIVIYW